jgi:hypothetical protein
MKLKHTLFLLTLTLLLSSCNLTNILPTADINLALVFGDSLTGTSDVVVSISGDATVGYSFTVPEMRVTGRALPGSLGAHFGSYSIDYFGSDDKPLKTAPGKSYRGILKLDVHPGIDCRDPAKPVDDCTVNSADSYPALGELATSTALSPIDLDILTELLAVPGQYGYADIVLDGTDSNGNAYSKLIPHVKIIFRLK